MGEEARVRWLKRIDSTSSYLKRNILKAHNPDELQGSWVVAYEQTGGYGRQGRSWSSSLGGLYCSFVVPKTKQPHDQTHTLSLLVGLVLYNTLSSFGLKQLQLKWPNDLLVLERKISGIALESLRGQLVCGFGLNVFLPAQEQVVGGKYQAAYLAELIKLPYINPQVPASGLEPAQAQFLVQLLSAFCENFACLFKIWDEQGFAAFTAEFESHLCFKGEEIQLERVDGSCITQGICKGIAPTGELLLQTSQGELVFAHAGEVHVRTSPGYKAFAQN